jgi:hypothetical protein
MRHSKLLVLFLLAGTLSLHAADIPTPSEFLKMPIGADRTLADYRQIRSYFAALDDASDRVVVETLGQTTLKEPMIMVIVSSEENIANLSKYREIAKKIADPRGLSSEERARLVRDGKAVVLVTCNIHSTEIASSQMAMEWAHALATSDDETTKARLDNVILLLVPSLNPDGQIMETEWYRKYLGTKYEGGRMPWLYHHYVGHDNNRDWFMLTQAETRNMSKALYHDWFPQVFVDEHQMGQTGPRMFIPPFSDPVDTDVNPLIWREVNVIGSNMALRLEQAGKSGLIYGYGFDAYWMGGTRNTAWWKNMTGLLLEVASASMASPIYVDPNELDGGRKGLTEYHAQINHPNPWPGGWWRMRDIMDYERIASDALLEIAAFHREDLLRNKLERATTAIREASMREAYLIPGAQRNRATAKRLAELMADHGVDVIIGENGDYWIPLSQPYSRFVRELMEPQRYPEIRMTGADDILRPYDVASWTLPMMMGVEVSKTRVPAVLLSEPRLEPWFSREAPKAKTLTGATHFAVEYSSAEVARVINAALGKGNVWVGEKEEADIAQAPVPVTFAPGTFYLDAPAAAAVADTAAEAGVSLVPLTSAPKSGRALRAPKIGLFKPWRASMDEGWTRWVFDTWGFKFENLDNAAVKKGKLASRFDVIVLPSIRPEIIASGSWRGRDRYVVDLPEPYQGGIGQDGTKALRSFVSEGGTLVAFAESTEWVMSEFNIPVRDALDRVSSEEFGVPGSLVRIFVDTTHPLGWGMPAESAAFLDEKLAFETSIPAPDTQRWVFARYPSDGKDMLLSGWIRGQENLERRAAAVAVTYGKGKIVLFGFRAQHRGQTHATLPMLFNSLYWSTW